MRRIYSDYAYGPGPRTGCWWDETIAATEWERLDGSLRVDVAIVGGGFTGLSAALTLAEAGVRVAVFEAETPGWGASGRNGGFCCLGGSRLGNAQIQQIYGTEARDHYYEVERAAIALVADRIDQHEIDVDRHSDGETLLAHSVRAWDGMRRSADAYAAQYGVELDLTEQAGLHGKGMNGPFHGAMTNPLGFALNPRKYLFGLAAAAIQAGARLFQNAPVAVIQPAAGRVILQTSAGEVRCDQVILATNGYSSEDVLPWLAGRYMPSQSNVIVTRPMTKAELDAQGWTSLQASYDSRNLLHYFRLMPDRRFLFGMRGGLRSSPASEKRARARNRADFERMFPAWAHVETPHSWSGMVNLAAAAMPFVGPVPDHPGVFAAMCYHGNGVAMGSWAGTALARSLLDPTTARAIPAPMRQPLKRFPFGAARRLIMPPLYALLKLADLR